MALSNIVHLWSSCGVHIALHIRMKLHFYLQFCLCYTTSVDLFYRLFQAFSHRHISLITTQFFHTSPTFFFIKINACLLHFPDQTIQKHSLYVCHFSGYWKLKLPRIKKKQRKQKKKLISHLLKARDVRGCVCATTVPRWQMYTSNEIRKRTLVFSTDRRG